MSIVTFDTLISFFFVAFSIIHILNSIYSIVTALLNATGSTDTCVETT
jgi:hypothetical protein